MTNRQAAIKIIKRLRSEGFEALLAGGCVRDMLAGRAAKDYDVATSARPDEIIALFRKTLKIGAKFGVVMVLLDSEQVEVATFRTESGYIDGRHPESVTFSNAKEDASRRDFTINGMFYDPVAKRVIDYVNGKADLKKGIIRTIGEPKKRFGEDYLRMLRAVRFATQFDFKIESATWRAVRGNAKKITGISAERIAMELEATLTHPNRWRGAVLLIESGLARVIFTGLLAKLANKGAIILCELRKKVNFPLALAGLFADCTDEFGIKKCDTLRLSRSQNKHIKFLLTNRGKLLDSQMPLAELKKVLSQPYFWDLYELQRAIQKANGESLAGLRKIRRRVGALAGAVLKPRPLLDGHQLIRLGAKPGPQVGQLAEELYIQQLEENLHNAKQAKLWAAEWLTKRKQIDR